ncbi:uncharacterized protein Dsimw501_GD27979 [Drosophila simulans]|uniref:Uncharacterized protein n=1 Tax=Drosophila simulans TaxID=7240 RepID=A0A0J9S0D6_DROSI|nr:uncharacterized protein Dsimw501_GD27979 [Drosophila simulans]
MKDRAGWNDTQARQPGAQIGCHWNATRRDQGRPPRSTKWLQYGEMLKGRDANAGRTRGENRDSSIERNTKWNKNTHGFNKARQVLIVRRRAQESSNRLRLQGWEEDAQKKQGRMAMREDIHTENR